MIAPFGVEAILPGDARNKRKLVRIVRVGAGLAVAALLLWLFFRDIEIGQVLTALSEAHPGWLVLVLAMTLLHYVVRAARWRLLLRPFHPAAPWRGMLEAILAGYAVSFLMPGRLGEIVRPAHLARRTGLPFAGVLTSVGLDRLLDALALVTLLIAYPLLAPVAGPGALPAEHAGTIRQAGLAAGAALILVLPALWLVVRFRDSLPLPDAASPGIRGLLGRHLGPLLDGLSVLRGPATMAVAVAGSLLIWIVLSAQVWSALEAFSIDLPFTAAFVVIAFLALGIAVPAPGGVGTFHYAGKFCLVEVFGVPAEKAVTAVLVLHLVAVLPAIVMGGWILAREGASLGDLLRGRGPQATAGGMRPAEPRDVQEGRP